MKQPLTIALILSLAGYAGTAFAQDADVPAERAIKYKARTEIDFDDVDVNGELVKPAGALLIDRKRTSFNPLIRLRQDFNPEMKQSLDKVK